MDPSQIKYKIIASIRKNDPNAEAFLFGFRARGNSTAKSDWDILILVDEKKITNEIEDKFRDELYDIELESGQIISTFIYSKNYWKENLIHSPLYKKIETEGIKL